MIEKQPFLDERIIEHLAADYGINVATLVSLALGADREASIYKAQGNNQSCYFVKLKRGHNHDISSAILLLLYEAGIENMIPPLKTTKGQLNQRMDDFTLIVYPFVEGQDGFSRNLTDDQWVTLGKALKKVHEINVPLSIQGQIRQEAYSPKWREILLSLYTHIEETEPGGDEIALKLRIFMKENATTIHQLLGRAEQLGQKLRKQSPEFVLCHSDIHGGNVLIDQNEAIYIVDWDDPVMAPKERDLMFIGGGVANVWNKPDEEKAFYKGYGKTEVNREILAYYRYERIVEDIALLGQELLLTTGDMQDRIEAYKQFMSQFDPQGVVEIAFKTDNGLALR
jgi:spectinomycin phosphotransferase